MNTIRVKNSPLLALRPATPTDENFLFHLYATTRADELAHIGWDAAQAQAFLRAQYATRRADQTRRFPTAEQSLILADTTEIGALTVDRSAAEIRLVDIAITHAWRGQSLGGQMITRLQEEARSASRPLVLSVQATNPAIRLYQRLGFVISGYNPPYVGMQWSSING